MPEPETPRDTEHRPPGARSTEPEGQKECAAGDAAARMVAAVWPTDRDPADQNATIPGPDQDTGAETADYYPQPAAQATTESDVPAQAAERGAGGTKVESMAAKSYPGHRAPRAGSDDRTKVRRKLGRRHAVVFDRSPASRPGEHAGSGRVRRRVVHFLRFPVTRSWRCWVGAEWASSTRRGKRGSIGSSRSR